MTIERVTTAFELVAILLLNAAVGLATYHRYGPIWALVATSLAFLLWSMVFEAIAGRFRAPAPAAAGAET